MPYRVKDGVLHFLMIKCNDRYEDFGGRTDPKDKSIRATIVREVSEESNEIIPTKYTSYQIRGSGIYLPNGKYLLFLIKAEYDYDPESFGTEEICEKIPRTVEWIPVTDIVNSFNLHPRLQSEKFFNALLLLQLNCLTL